MNVLSDTIAIETKEPRAKRRKLASCKIGLLPRTLPLPAQLSVQLIAITGGPGSGKSTLIQALASQGLQTIPEAAIQVINELNTEFGVDGQKEWRKTNKDEFQERVTRKQAALEASASKEAKFAFCDRGRLDGLGYCRHFKQAVPDAVADIAESASYAKVFLLETLSEDAFANRGADGRTSGRQDSVAISKCIGEVYEEHGHTLVRVPVLPVEQRVAWVLSSLGLNES